MLLVDGIGAVQNSDYMGIGFKEFKWVHYIILSSVS